MTYHQIRGIAAVSGGVWSMNTALFTGDSLKQVVLIATTSTTIFDFTIEDSYGIEIFPDENVDSTAIEGSLNVTDLAYPLVGIYTLKITNSTRDEDIQYLLMVEEETA
jgi:hypothetical protein